MDLHELHDSLLTQQGMVNGDWDIAHLVTDWIAEAADQGACEDLAPYIAQQPPEDFPQGWPASLLAFQQYGERTLALPFHDGPECLVYRKDLFEDPAEQAAFRQAYHRELAPPQTWEEFLETAAFFQRPEQQLYGTAFAAFPDGHNTVFDFCLQLWTRNGELTDGTQAVRIDTPEAAAALDFYRQVISNPALVHPQSHHFDSVKLGAAFANGELAMMINWFGFASVCDVETTCPVHGKVAIASVPKGAGGRHASLNVYWMYTIATGSRQKALAYDFIRFATSRANDRALTLQGGIGCRLSTWHDAEVNRTVPYYHQLEALHQNACTLPRHRQWAAIAAIIDRAVIRASGTSDASAIILAEAQQEIEQLRDNHHS